MEPTTTPTDEIAGGFMDMSLDPRFAKKPVAQPEPEPAPAPEENS